MVRNWSLYPTAYDEWGLPTTRWVKLNVDLLAPEKPWGDRRPGWQLDGKLMRDLSQMQLNHSRIPDTQKLWDDKDCFKQLCFRIICYITIDNSYITQMSTNGRIYIYVLFIQWHITQKLEKKNKNPATQNNMGFPQVQLWTKEAKPKEHIL